MIMRLFKRLAAAVVAVALVMPLATSVPALAADFNPDTGETVQTVSLVPSLCSSSYRVSGSPSPSTVIDSSPSGVIATNYYQFYRPVSLDTAPTSPFSAYTTYRCNFAQPGHVSSLHLQFKHWGSSTTRNMSIKVLARAYLVSGGYVDVSGSSDSVGDAFNLTFPSYNGDVSYILFCAVGALESAGNGSACITMYRSCTATLSQFEETGLLRSIIEWLKGIKDGISNGFSSVLSSLSGLLSAISSGFSSVLSSLSSLLSAILELPEKIINLFKTAMQWLFVPSQDDLANLSDRFESVMSVKLGGVWEVESFVVGLLTGIIGAGSQTTITFPGISVPLAGATFSLASAEVEIFPGAFSALQTPCKVMVTAVFLGAWLYGVQRYLDKFLGGDSE